MCAKVTGPLFSISASGKMADAMVFFSWKGINSVRQWVVPSNPKSTDQGDVRLVLGGVGRACSAVKKDSDYSDQLVALDIIPANQTRQSYLVKKIIDSYMSNATNFENLVTEFSGHTASADFTSAAGSLALADFNVEYKGTASAFSKGLMVYVLAKLAIALGFTGVPYTTALASWTSTEITAFLADLAAPV